MRARHCLDTRNVNRNGSGTPAREKPLRLIGFPTRAPDRLHSMRQRGLETMEAASRPVFEPLTDLPVEAPIDGSVPIGATSPSSGASPRTAGSVAKPEDAAQELINPESLLGSGDWLATFMDHGKQSATIHKVISPDGKTMTQTAKFVDAHGQTLTQIQVFRGQ